MQKTPQYIQSILQLFMYKKKYQAALKNAQTAAIIKASFNDYKAKSVLFQKLNSNSNFLALSSEEQVAFQQREIETLNEKHFHQKKSGKSLSQLIITIIYSNSKSGVF